jgi:beta-fructofuranosidase
MDVAKLCVLSSVLIGGSFAQLLTPNSIEKMGNNTLFTRWRPISHIIAPAGWMNDPCGPMYDPTSGYYHISYQWHSDHVNWGNISWGHATSKDLITWRDVDSFPNDGISAAWVNNQAEAIGTTNISSTHHKPPNYNHLGIWSGTAQPYNLTGGQDGTLLAFYTSVSRLPLGWDQTYPTGSESQSYAYSADGGATWQQYENNPVISTPPPGWNITGFRDPFFQKFPALDEMLNYTEDHFYVIFGSGINGSGPRIPLYSTPASNLTAWTFLGALDNTANNVSLGDPIQTGATGSQYEVVNFFDLEGHWFQSGGTQGGIATFRNFWNEGNVSTRSNGSIQFTPISAGSPDWGNLYAITSFHDTRNNRRLQIGWSPEDSINNYAATQQGYQGSLSLPRRLFVHTVSNVVPPKNHTAIQNSIFTRQHNNTFSARTLGARPAKDIVRGLRFNATHSSASLTTLMGAGGGRHSHRLANMSSSSYEFSVLINSTTGRTGIIIAASPTFQEYTSIYFDPHTHTIACNRTYSSLLKGFLNTTYTGHFAPYNSSLTHKLEPVHMRIFVDGSLVEISVNDRFWMTSRIYPAQESSVGVGVYAAPGVEVVYGGLEWWDGLRNVWPHRPQNSSTLLLQDTAAETGNFTWWPGN